MSWKDDEGNLIGDIELEPEELRNIIPGRDLDKALSIAYKDVERVDVVSAYPDWDVEAMEAYYKNRPKGTFDA